jgi:hypothetical protein
VRVIYNREDDVMRVLKCFIALGLVIATASMAAAAPVYTLERAESLYGITNPVLRTAAFVYDTVGSPGSATWEIALPNGTYWVTTTCGDVGYVVGPQKVVVEGQTAINNVVTAINSFAVDQDRRVDLTDGALTVTIGNASGTHPQAYRQTNINSIVITSVDPGTQSFTPVDIDFAPVSPGAAAGFELDSGAVYADRGNGFTYGWDTDQTGYMFAKPGSSAQENRTVLKTLAGTTRTWELAVPNGMYFVSVAVGDETQNNAANRVTIEDNLFVPNVNLSATEYYTVENAIVYVYDGKLTLKVGGGTEGSTASPTSLCWVKVTNERPAGWTFPMRINVQPGYTRPLKGYQIENGAMYSGGVTGRGWGFEDEVRLTKECASIVGPAESKNLQQVFNTFVATNPGQTKDWKLDNLTPNGTYYVYLCAGDPRYSWIQRVAVEGTALINDVTTAVDRYAMVNGASVNVGPDGELNVAVGGNSNPLGYTTLSYLVVDDAPYAQWPIESGKYAIRVNFQPAGLSPQAGYAVDAGDPFCPVRKCGWSPEVFTRYWDYGNGKLLDSFAITRPGEKNVWDVSVPANRNYLVTAWAGDPRPGYNYNQRVAVESPSNYIIYGMDSDGVPLSGSCTVTSSDTADGLIRLYVGGDSSPFGYTTINYVTIMEQ